MAFTTDDLARIDRVIAAGELTVRFADGKSVTYRSMDELMRAKSQIAGELAAAANAGAASRRTILTTYGRG